MDGLEPKLWTMWVRPKTTTRAPPGPRVQAGLSGPVLYFLLKIYLIFYFINYVLNPNSCVCSRLVPEQWYLFDLPLHMNRGVSLLNSRTP